MKAVILDKLGSPDNLRVGDFPKPEAAEGQVLIKVRAAGIGQYDWKFVAGMFGDLPTPLVPGLELAGVIEEADGRSGFKPGDEVFSGASGGAFAEYIAVAADRAAPKPASLSFEEAASLVIAASTAHEALVDHLAVQPGETVLIVGASGGTGSAAVQVAKGLGARVIGVASERNLDYLRKTGADEAVDYKHPSWSDEVLKIAPGGVDAVLDAVGGEATAEAAKAVRDGGRMALIAGKPPELDPARNIKVDAFAAKVGGARLAFVAELVDQGKLKAEITEVVDLEDVADAVKRNQEGHTRGKVVVKIA